MKALNIRRESKAVKTIFASNQRHVPETRDARGIVLNWHFLHQLLQEFSPLPIFTQVFAERLKALKADRRADEKHRLPLLARENDFMRRANTIDVCRPVRDDEIAGIDHS